MTHREHFFSVLDNKKSVNMPFFPDITDWYTSHRTPAGEPRKYGPAEFIPDDNPFHNYPGTIPMKYRDFTLFDFYREFDWGFPVHIGNWYDEEYTGHVEKINRVDNNIRTITYHTSGGDLTHKEMLAADGTWAIREHFVKKLQDLDIICPIVESTRFTPRFDRVKAVMEEMGEHGLGDIVIWRSPFGKLVHEYMGFERVVYALADEPNIIHDFLKLQEKKDIKLINLAADSPERLVIISDHADENLIAPPYYETYCIPFYQKACDILHKAGKLVSTHLDGNFKGFFPIISKTGFDLLDGCTPAPMFNYEIEELAEALPKGMKAFCGVPSTLFCRNLPIEEIISYAERIINSFKGRGIINIGDILPPDGDIEQVIALGEYVKSTWK